jgi:hypothetical protein
MLRNGKLHLVLSVISASVLILVGSIIQAEATAAAEAAGRPPPSEALLYVACKAAGEAQMQLAAAESTCVLEQRWAVFGRHRPDLEAILQVRHYRSVCTVAGAKSYAGTWNLPEMRACLSDL